jgi:hypothetical protein
VTVPAAHAWRSSVPDSYVVLNEEDRITHVSRPLRDDLGRWLGHVIWDHLPGAKDVYGPAFTVARTSGEPVETIVFYSGRVKRLVVIPGEDGLAVHVERLAELDVTSLSTLRLSLERIACALADPTSGRRGSRARASLQALP